jgi:hypothetical protein
MRNLAAAALALALGLPMTTSPASAASLEGSWSGRGTIRLTSGQVEPVSCSVKFEKSTGRTFVLNARCSTTAGVFEQSGRVVQTSSRKFSGRLYSDQYAVSGDLRISISGTSQTVRISSPKGSGSLKLRKR